MIKSKREQNLKIKKIDTKFYFSLLIFLFIIGYPIYFLVKSCAATYTLSNESKISKGVVIDEKNFTGHSPVNQTFYYSYEFEVNNEKYKGNTLNKKYRIGDSVDVIYAISNPSYNSIKKDTL